MFVQDGFLYLIVTKHKCFLEATGVLLRLGQFLTRILTPSCLYVIDIGNEGQA